MRIIILLFLSAAAFGQSNTFKWVNQIPYTASGTNTYTLSITGYQYYKAGDEIKVTFTNANTGTATVNVNGLGAVGLRKNGSTPLSSGDIAAGGTYILSHDGTNFQVLNIPGAGGGGGGGGLVYTFAATAPATSSIWVDTGNGSMNAFPIRNYVSGAWTPVTDECDWWDNIGKVVSKGKPIAILFSGQSNVGSASYTPASTPSYVGDVAVDNHIALWQPTTAEWKVYDNTAATAGYRLWSTPAGGSVADNLFNPGYTNQLWVFAKFYARQFSRSVRLVGTRRGGQPLAQWEAGKLAWNELVSVATASGVPRFDAFIWIHGEAELSDANNPSTFTFYKDSFYDLIARLRSQSWADEKLKIIMPSHAYNVGFVGAHATPIVSELTAEGTARSLDNQDSPYSGWAAWAVAREAQNGATDAFHYTTREHERQGMAIFQTYLSLPNYKKGDKLFRTFYTNANNRLTVAKVVTPAADDFEWIHHGGFSTTSTYKRSFLFNVGAGGNPAIQEEIGNISGSNRWSLKSIAYLGSTLNEKLAVWHYGVEIPKILYMGGTGHTLGQDIDGSTNGIVFRDVGGSINDVWIARDATNAGALIYKSGSDISGAHRFTIANTERMRLSPRLGSVGSEALELFGTDLRIDKFTTNGYVRTSGGNGLFTVSSTVPASDIASVRRFSNTFIIATDANITAAAGATYTLPAGTLTTNKNIDMTNLNTDGDYIEFINQEVNFTWSFTGQAVYFSDNITTASTLLAQTNYIIRRQNGRLIIIN